MTQQELKLSKPGWGGKRAGAGRKPRPGLRPAPHRTRSIVTPRFPLHVTWRLQKGLPNLRAKHAMRAIEGAMMRACERPAFRLVHFSVQRTHLHLVVEAGDAPTLSRCLQGLGIGLAKSLNALWGRSGRVFAERYHAHALRTPLEVQRALRYVLCNTRRHERAQGTRRHPRWLDPCTSARFFDGWQGIAGTKPKHGDPVVRPRGWLLERGWRRHGLIDPAAVPGR